MSMLRVQVRTSPLPLSHTAAQALKNVGQYDLVVFTSANAQNIFISQLRGRGTVLPRKVRVVQVGPRKELLRLSVRGRRILFPRSSAAPYDIVRLLRSRGATVRPITLYATRVVPLTRAQKDALAHGTTKAIYFRSTSGVRGLLRQLHGVARRNALLAHAQCIGQETARAAKRAGFKKVSVVGILREIA